MYVLLAAFSLLFPSPDLSNHWRWASASVNQSSVSPTPVPSPVVPVPSPTPNPVPTPVPTPNPTPVLKPGDDCPGCTGGWIDSDGSAKVKCWKCNGDGRVDIGDPILTGTTEPDNGLQGILSQPERDRINEDLKQTPSKKTEADKGTGSKETNKADDSKSSEVPESTDPDSKAICYKPIYSKDGYWIWDLEGKKWLRSSKQPPTYKQVATGHWETKSYQYKSCNGRSCSWKTGYKKVWVAGPAKKVLQPSTPQASHYPIRGNWWSGCRNWSHLTKGVHAGKFDPTYLKRLSYEELQSLHSDAHEGRTKWQYVNK